MSANLNLDNDHKTWGDLSDWTNPGCWGDDDPWDFPFLEFWDSIDLKVVINDPEEIVRLQKVWVLERLARANGDASNEQTGNGADHAKGNGAEPKEEEPSTPRAEAGEASKEEAPSTTPATLKDLKERPLWVGWRTMTLSGRDKPTKIPFNANSNGQARSDDPRTWTLFYRAEHWLKTKHNHGDGIGIMFAPIDETLHLAGIDLDTCRDPKTGALEPWALEVIERFASYTEVSPSKTGVKIFLLYRLADKAELDKLFGGADKHGRQFKKGGGEHPQAIEIYRSNRYFATTFEQYESFDRLRVVSVADIAWLINETGPALKDASTSDNTKASSSGAYEGSNNQGNDNSRSGKAFREGARLKARGASYEEMRDALLNHSDAEISEWARTKGSANNERELHRVYDHAGNTSAGHSNELSHNQAMERFNAKFAVVEVSNKVRFLHEGEDVDGRPSYQLLNRNDFVTLTANRGYVMVRHGQSVVAVAANTYWIKETERREHEAIVFRPGEEILPDPGSNSPWPKFYNLWRGWGVEPNEKGSCEKFKQHLRDNVCGGVQAHYDWLRKWMAHLFQKPREKPGVAVALRGKIGVGKTIVGMTLGKLVGRRHHVVLDQQDQLIGKFNKSQEGSLLTQAEEAVWVHDPSAAGHMKALITGTKRPIEPKGIDVYMVDNCARILLTSNADAMVPAEPGERRYFVLDVLDTHAKDTAYFGAMEDELKADNDAGYGRLLWELQHTDLTGFDFRNAPNTDALADQKQHNLPAVAQWLLNRLIDARWWRWTEDEDPLAYLDHSPTFDGPPAKVKDRAPIISKDVAMEDYLAFCRATNHRTHIDEGQFAKKLKEYAGLVSTRRRAPCTIRWGDKLICRKGEREYCFKLPELEEARELFLKKFDLNSMIFNEARAEDAMIAAQDEAAKDKVKAEAAKAGAAKPKTT